MSTSTQRWTDETDREAEKVYATFTEGKIRRYQDLTRQQIGTAYQNRNEGALIDLQRQQDALTRAMLVRMPGVAVEPLR